MKQTVFCLLAGAFMAVPGIAQNKKVVADKIVGIVGDKIILYSDIQNAVGDMQRQGTALPPHPECAVMEQALTSKVLMLQALKDSLPVSDEDVEAELDQRVRYFIQQYGSQEAVEQIAGKTIYQIKDEARESVKERKLAEAMQHKIVENIRITPQEVKAYFDKVPKDSLPFFESQVEIGQVILYPKASRDMETYTIDELNNLRKQIISGAVSFAVAAKGSDDPGSKDRGGQYQINRNEKTWDPAFMREAFRLKDGEISPVFKSKFGYHIIQMVQRNGDDAIVRHILKVPTVTQDEVRQSLNRLDSVRAQLLAGNETFNILAGKVTEDPNAKFTGPFIISRGGDTYNTIDELDKDVVAQLDKLQVGQYSQPYEFTDERGTKAVRFLYLKSRSEPHRMNLRDDYNRISTAALEEKKYNALDKWIQAHIADYYIMVDDAEMSCPQLGRFKAAATVAR